jgi:hypothetical protein
MCFNEIFESFANSIKRDPEFEKLIQKIGQTYLGISYNSGFDLMGMMEGLLK